MIQDLENTQSNTFSQSRITQRRLLRTVSNQVLKISKNGDSATPPGNLFHRKSASCCSDRTSCVLVRAHWLLSCHWAPHRRVQFHLQYTWHEVFTLIGKIPLSLLFSRLKNLSSLRLSSQDRCSSSFIVFVDLGWTHSSMSVFVLYRRPQNWIQHSGYISPARSKVEESPLLTCWQHSFSCSPGYLWTCLSVSRSKGIGKCIQDQGLSCTSHSIQEVFLIFITTNDLYIQSYSVLQP